MKKHKNKKPIKNNKKGKGKIKKPKTPKKKSASKPKPKKSAPVKKKPTRPLIKKAPVAPIVAKKPATAVSGPMGIKPYKLTKDEAYMNNKQLEHFKNILNIWKEQLISEMSRTVQHMKNDAANFPDPVDRASQEEEFNLELKTRERERKLIKKIDESLEKIQGGDYGFCLDCGAEIGIKRLEARPTATQCIECKTIAEIREKQQTGG